jgi:hypothetical protein
MYLEFAIIIGRVLKTCSTCLDLYIHYILMLRIFISLGTLFFTRTLHRKLDLLRVYNFYKIIVRRPREFKNLVLIDMSFQKNRNTHDRKCNAGTYEILEQVFLIRFVTRWSRQILAHIITRIDVRLDDSRGTIQHAPRRGRLVEWKPAIKLYGLMHTAQPGWVKKSVVYLCIEISRPMGS